MLLAFLWPGVTHAGVIADVFFHMQGEPGNRQAFFANTLVSDRTPVSMVMQLGSIEIKQLDVTVIYENAQQPEWAEMRLQFECISKVDYGKGVPKPAAWTDPVKMRLGEGGTILRRSDLKIEATPAGAWQTANSPVLLKAHKLACNADEVAAAVKASATGKTLDNALFNTELRKIGFTEDVTLMNGTAPEFLELAWTRLWAGSKRPDPSGKWAKKATPEEKAAAMAKVAAVQKQLAELTQKTKQAYEPKIQAAEIKFDFDKVAAKLRNGREMNRTESQMLMVWQGKLEEEVASIIGRPSITETGNVRFLSYGKDYDTRTAFDYKGATYVTHGVYWSCDVQFVTTPDRQGAFRVADVRIRSDSNMNLSHNTACEGLLHVPGN
jgi:hypothetical protein